MSEQPESVHGSVFLRGGNGVGSITPETVEERARELAKIDGRSEVNDGDRALAQEELTTVGSQVEAPEVGDTGADDLVTWDESPDATGVHTSTVRPEDDMNIAQALMEEGIEEADHEQRLAAAEENPPEEE